MLGPIARQWLGGSLRRYKSMLITVFQLSLISFLPTDGIMSIAVKIQLIVNRQYFRALRSCCVVEWTNLVGTVSWQMATMVHPTSKWRSEEWGKGTRIAHHSESGGKVPSTRSSIFKFHSPKTSYCLGVAWQFIQNCCSKKVQSKVLGPLSTVELNEAECHGLELSKLLVSMKEVLVLEKHSQLPKSS